MFKRLLTVLGTAGAAGILGVSLLASASAAGNVVVVTPNNTQGWTTQDTNAGGQVNYITDTSADAPYPPGALQLLTDATTTAKAQYFHATSTALSDVNELSYYTKQVSATFPQADPSYQLAVQLNGTSGFSTLVFEPYQGGEGAVIPGAWQSWNVASGLFWSTHTVTCSNGTVAGTPGGPATYTLSALQTLCPSAVVIGFGVNIGSNNPSWNVETDGVDFNGTTYDFQTSNPPASKEQCKHGGYQNLTDGNGQPFKNQGQCIKYFNHH
ncbi:MAG: hypothetical protein ACRDFX_01575 [Chloroflexota bacterium]